MMGEVFREGLMFGLGFSLAAAVVYLSIVIILNR